MTPVALFRDVAAYDRSGVELVSSVTSNDTGD
jgi:hypothetical protein